MADKKRLIDANAMREDWLENGENEYVYDTNAVLASIDAQPTVEAYTGEQLRHILNSLDKAEAENKEMRKENAWLKSCLNCKIRKECPRHCGKVVHNCDHWEYGDNAKDSVEVVHGRWEKHEATGFMGCSNCWDVFVDKEWLTEGRWNYCPNCGAKMDGDGNG